MKSNLKKVTKKGTLDLIVEVMSMRTIKVTVQATNLPNPR